VTAGSCSSRLIFNVPKARAVGGEVEFGLAPTNSFDFSLSASYTDSTVRSTLDSTPDVIQATGIREGNRLPGVPKFQAAVAATYHQPIGQGFNGYVSGTYQHTGSRYTQIADQEPGVGNALWINGTSLNLNSFGKNTIGGPLTQSTFTFDPLLPAYDIVNLRLGVRHDIWDIALYVNNLTNEHALLSLDRERGFRARVGYVTNQPRTFGITNRVDF
jgi:iron complex outermembrane recepter protein